MILFACITTFTCVTSKSISLAAVFIINQSVYCDTKPPLPSIYVRRSVLRAKKETPRVYIFTAAVGRFSIDQWNSHNLLRLAAYWEDHLSLHSVPVILSSMLRFQTFMRWGQAVDISVHGGTFAKRDVIPRSNKCKKFSYNRLGPILSCLEASPVNEA